MRGYPNERVRSRVSSWMFRVRRRLCGIRFLKTDALYTIRCTLYIIRLNGGWRCDVWMCVALLLFNPAVSHCSCHLKLHDYNQKYVLVCYHLWIILSVWECARVMARSGKYFFGSFRWDFGGRYCGKPRCNVPFSVKCINGNAGSSA